MLNYQLLWNISFSGPILKKTWYYIMEIIEMHIEFFSEGQNKKYLSLKYHSDYI